VVCNDVLGFSTHVTYIFVEYYGHRYQLTSVSKGLCPSQTRSLTASFPCCTETKFLLASSIRALYLHKDGVRMICEVEVSGFQLPTPYNSNVLKVLGIFYKNIPYSFMYIYICHICEIFTSSYFWNIYIYLILSYLNIRNAPSNKSSFVAIFATRQRSSSRRSFQLFGLKAWVQNAAEGTSTRKPWF
jgi:hypothetical protein